MQNMTDNLLITSKGQQFSSSFTSAPSNLESFIGGGGVESPERDGGATSLPPKAEGLLYLNSNISIETHTQTEVDKTLNGLSSLLSPYSKRVTFTLQENVKRLLNLAPDISYLGFLTLTFKENITCPKEASKRFKSFNTNFLSKSKDFLEWIVVRERQKRGAWHYHLLVRLPFNIRAGFDWELYDIALQLRRPEFAYRSPENAPFRKWMRKATKTASPRLKRYWKDIRLACSKYGFGRSEMLPIKTNVKAMALYVGKYISKELGERSTRDKGVRLVNYSSGWIKNSVKFQWHSDGSQEWRRKLYLFARVSGCKDMYGLKKKLGSAWAYNYMNEILEIDQFIENNNLDPEQVKMEDLPDQFIEKMKKHNNRREAKIVRLCPLCGRKGIRQWQDNDLYCAHCGGLIF